MTFFSSPGPYKKGPNEAEDSFFDDHGCFSGEDGSHSISNDDESAEAIARPEHFLKGLGLGRSRSDDTLGDPPSTSIVSNDQAMKVLFPDFEELIAQLEADAVAANSPVSPGERRSLNDNPACGGASSGTPEGPQQESVNSYFAEEPPPSPNSFAGCPSPPDTPDPPPTKSAIATRSPNSAGKKRKGADDTDDPHREAKRRKADEPRGPDYFKRPEHRVYMEGFSEKIEFYTRTDQRGLVYAVIGTDKRDDQPAREMKHAGFRENRKKKDGSWDVWYEVSRDDLREAFDNAKSMSEIWGDRNHQVSDFKQLLIRLSPPLQDATLTLEKGCLRAKVPLGQTKSGNKKRSPLPALLRRLGFQEKDNGDDSIYVSTRECSADYLGRMEITSTSLFRHM